MTSTLVFSMRGRAGRFGSVALAFAAAGMVGCGSSTLSIASSSSAPAGPATPAGASSSSSSVGTGSGTPGWSVTGTYKGQTLQGPVTIERVLCTPISVGGSNGVQMVWSGTVHNTPTGQSDQISGDMSFPQIGTWTIPTNDRHTPVASLVVGNDYTNRYGLSSGTGGLGSGRLEATATTGSVDASYSNGSEMLALKGDWTCSS